MGNSQEVLASQAGAATELLQRCSEMQQQQAAAGATSAVQGETQAWWMDDQTRNFMVDSLQLDGNLVLTVDKDAPKIVSYQDVSKQSYHKTTFPARLTGLARYAANAARLPS